MLNDFARECAEGCLTRARSTADVDHQSLLLFLAEAWDTVARTGESRDVVPDYLKQPSSSRRIVEPVS